ncbi:glycoside hydrolase family 114 protein [Hyaloscypha variabilis F]|jgi:endo-alpha-1,4-polygalactosaminidase (GH114 family)|uniref:alpha-galactosidase n=1 Tax=Hyaloscypha variabilis (strain UAMH 11265 / GT02V1 / F) TaxID=1149755 RepID=A0A2J6SC99_HYAVF|nr:glycoside hydrolase family 114 protein [Hyaloscypha variabilis F]
MLKRLDREASMMRDGVDTDNTDAYNNENGLNLTMEDAVSYVTFLAEAAHARNPSIGLENSRNIVPSVLDEVQWQFNEQCVVYREFSTFRPFIAAGKPVFHIEYPSSAPTINATTKAQYCNNSRETGFSTILKKVSLDGWIDAC